MAVVSIQSILEGDTEMPGSRALPQSRQLACFSSEAYGVPNNWEGNHLSISNLSCENDMFYEFPSACFTSDLHSTVSIK